MSIFGQSPLGTELGPFGGPGLITVLGVLPLGNGGFIVVWDREPTTLDPDAYDSATNEQNYAVVAVDPTIVVPGTNSYIPPGEVVPTRAPFAGVASRVFEDPTQTEVLMDSSLEPHVRYTVTISPTIRGVDGEVFAGPNVFGFRAPLLGAPIKPPSLVAEDRYRDLDYVYVPRRHGDQSLTYHQDATGDIPLQSADESLKKRIYRRVFTEPGSMAWSPSYGVGLKIKALARTGRLQAVANAIADQIRLEPDVLNAGVEAYTTRVGGAVILQVDAYVERRGRRDTLALRFQEQI